MGGFEVWISQKKGKDHKTWRDEKANDSVLVSFQIQPNEASATRSFKLKNGREWSKWTKLSSSEITTLRCGSTTEPYSLASSASLLLHFPPYSHPFHGKLSFWTLICCVCYKKFSSAFLLALFLFFFFCKKSSWYEIERFWCWKRIHVKVWDSKVWVFMLREWKRLKLKIFRGCEFHEFSFQWII